MRRLCHRHRSQVLRRVCQSRLDRVDVQDTQAIGYTAAGNWTRRVNQMRIQISTTTSALAATIRAIAVAGCASTSDTESSVDTEENRPVSSDGDTVDADGAIDEIHRQRS